ncbi:MAG: hypothetical protein HQL95_07690 [Magnetococcales bacterium]|nr:hypothetical protein [Magnetococcales bacterium]
MVAGRKVCEAFSRSEVAAMTLAEYLMRLMRLSRLFGSGNAPETQPFPRLQRLVLGIGLLLFIGSGLGWVFTVDGQRRVPVEYDDALSYSNRALQFGECYFQDCPALKDLREQTTWPSADPAIQERRREGFALVLPRPFELHSALLWSVHHGFGLHWNHALTVVRAFGVVLIGAGIGWWLSALIAPGAAGGALILLSVINHPALPGAGLFQIIPSNMTLGLAMFCWGWILHSRERLGYGLLVMLAALHLSHPVGFPLAVLTWTLYALLRPWPWSARTLRVVSAGLVVIVALQLVTFFSQYPLLRASFPALAALGQESHAAALLKSLATVEKVLREWLAAVGLNKWLLAGMLPLIVLLPPPGGWVVVPVFLVLLAGLCGAGLLYVTTVHPAEVFSRFWPLLALLLTGLYVWFLLRALELGWRAMRDRTAVWRSGAGGVAWLGVAFLAAGSLLAMYRNYQTLPNLVRHTIQRHDFVFDERQPARLLERNHPCDKVLYLDHLAFLGFMGRSEALRCGLLYHPAFKDTPEAPRLETFAGRITHVVASHPVMLQRNRLDLSRNRPSWRLAGETPVERLSVRLFNSSAEPARVVLRTPGTGESSSRGVFELAGQEERWFTVALSPPWQPGEGLEFVQSGDGVMLSGLRRGEHHACVAWPWQQGITLNYLRPASGSKPKKEFQVDFTLGDRLPASLGRLRVVRDQGTTVLALPGEATGEDCQPD